MKKYFGLLLIIALISCKPKTVENSGGLIIDIDITGKTAKEKDIATAIDILKSRVDLLCPNSPTVELIEGKNTIQVKLPLTKDSMLYKENLLIPGKLSIVETYENKEVYKSLQDINESLFNNFNYQFQIPIDSTNKLTKLPLFRVLYPAITSDGNLINGPEIGYSKDTALVNSILKFNAIKTLFPADFDFKWARINSNGLFPLIAIKKTIRYQPITSQMVSDSRAIKNSFGWEVNFTLKPEYCKTWADITKNNIGRALAIVIDNNVLSYPRVNSEITGGKATISSNMTPEQAKALSTILKYRAIPFEFKIKKIKEIKAP
ncbi:MAG: hypothetical protein HXX16_15080 [Bacteroidales bacterium]|nr:hypothetical protein [Bacteroidales bacterium]